MPPGLDLMRINRSLLTTQRDTKPILKLLASLKYISCLRLRLHSHLHTVSTPDRLA
jgi:hypothetical protein